MGKKPKHLPLISIDGIFTPWSVLSPTKQNHNHKHKKEGNDNGNGNGNNNAINEETLGRIFPPPQIVPNENGGLTLTMTELRPQSQSQSQPQSILNHTGMGMDMDFTTTSDTGTGTGTSTSTSVDKFNFTDTGQLPPVPYDNDNDNSMARTEGGPITKNGIGIGIGGFSSTNPATDYDPTLGIPYSTVQQWLNEDPLDFVSSARLQRAFYILGQSTTLTKKDCK